ncbi:MAG: D-aminoacylase [Planctomycetes bacterium]|nr:D-aminoacylase [Planctomycetota bacterium]
MNQTKLHIKDGTVIDGSGEKGFRADVLVVGDRIEAVGEVQPPADAVVIDASGCVAAPGFIDIHSHSDLMILADPFPIAKTRQGVTTELIGGCGFSLAPLTEHVIPELKNSGVLGEADLDWSWRSYGDLVSRMEATPFAHNVGGLIGHNTIRIAVLGMGNVEVTDAALGRMKDYVREGMEAGAFGMSSGLIYTPGLYANADELSELCKVVAQYGGIYATHMRNEGVRLIEAVEESIGIAERSGAPLHIVHLKVTGEENYPLIERALGRIYEAREQGLDVTFDQYPYTAGSTGLSALIPNWVREGGLETMLARLQDAGTRQRVAGEMARGGENMLKYSWDKVLLSSVASEANKGIEGKTIEEIARIRGCDPVDAVFDVLVEEHGRAGMVAFSMSEESVRLIMKAPFGMVGTDGIHGGKCHPRLYGTFPRILGRYVRQENVLPLELAIRKMTSNPADRLGLSDRGRIEPGKRGDIVIFDPDTIIDRATYEDPAQYPAGITHVIIGGQVVIENGRATGEMPGRFVRSCSEARGT